MGTRKIKNTVKPLSEPQVIIRTIGQLKDEQHCELYFDQDTFNMLIKRNWKVSNIQNIPNRMLEIMQIGYETFRGKLPLTVNVTNYNTDAVFLWYLVLFLKGEVPAAYNTNYISFDQASQKFKDNILNAELEISTLSSAVPGKSVSLFEESDNTLQNTSSIKPSRKNSTTRFAIGQIISIPIEATHFTSEGGIYKGTEILFVDHQWIIKHHPSGYSHEHWVCLKENKKKEVYNIFDPTFLQTAKRFGQDFCNFIQDLAEAYNNRGKQNTYSAYLYNVKCNIKFVVGEIHSSEFETTPKSMPLF